MSLVPTLRERLGDHTGSFDSAVSLNSGSRAESIYDHRRDSETSFTTYTTEHGAGPKLSHVNDQVSQRVEGPTVATPTRDLTSASTNQAGDFSRAFGIARETFSKRASQFVDIVRQYVQSQPPGEAWSSANRFFETLQPLYNELERSHDVYGALESEYIKYREDHDPRTPRTNSGGQTPHDTELQDDNSSFHQMVPRMAASESGVSEGSFLDPEMVDVHLLTTYVDKLARADYYYDLSQDALMTKEDLIEAVRTAEPSGPGISPFSAELVSDLGRDYDERLVWYQAATRELRALYQQMFDNGLVANNQVFDTSVTLVPWNAPPRSPLLMSLEELMNVSNGKPYDQPEVITMSQGTYDPEVLAFRLNRWLLHVLRRSPLLVLLFKNELIELGVIRAGEETSALFDYWADDVATKQLREMQFDSLFTVGSTPDSKRLSLDADEQIKSSIQQYSSDDTHTRGTGQQFGASTMEEGSQERKLQFDDKEILELFGDIDEADIPIVPLRRATLVDAAADTLPLPDTREPD